MAQNFIGTLTVLDCARCGLTFGITKEFEKRRRNDHEGFFCPAGHSNIYQGETEEERLRRERDRLKQNEAYLEDRLREEREKKNAARRQAIAFKGVTTRIKRRVAAGLCPCCNRTFQNLAAHMATKHKGYEQAKEQA